MEEILYQEVDTLNFIPLFTGFYIHPRWWSQDFWTINSISPKSFLMRSWVDIIVKFSQGLNQWGIKQTYAFQVVNSHLSPPLILRLLGLDIGPNNVMFWKAPMLTSF